MLKSKKLRVELYQISLFISIAIIISLFAYGYIRELKPLPQGNKDTFEAYSYAFFGPISIILSACFSFLVYRVSRELNDMEKERIDREKRIKIVLRTNAEGNLQIVNMSPSPVYVIGLSYYNSKYPERRDLVVDKSFDGGNLDVGGQINIQKPDWDNFFKNNLPTDDSREGISVRFYHTGYDNKLETVHFINFSDSRDKNHSRFDVDKTEFKEIIV